MTRQIQGNPRTMCHSSSFSCTCVVGKAWDMQGGDDELLSRKLSEASKRRIERCISQWSNCSIHWPLETRPWSKGFSIVVERKRAVLGSLSMRLIKGAM